MNTWTMAMPGALRMRSLYPLLEGDASCSLVYDLERAVVLDVPQDLQLHVASALETGDIDDGLLDWMIAEDLWTADGGMPGEEAEAPLIMTSWWNPGLVFRRGGELHARIDNSGLESALGALEFIFKQSLGASRIILRLSWGGNFPSTQTLEGIVVEGNRRATQARQEIRYELSLDSWAVTPAVALFLADYPFHVRLHCGRFPSLPARETAAQREAHAWQRAEQGVRRLAAIADRLTVQCVLAGPARLRDLWVWAKRLDVRHLDPVRLEDDDPLTPYLRNYSKDLLSIGEEVCAELNDTLPPIDCQPLSRVVNKLMRSESQSRAPELAPPPHREVGDVYPTPEEEDVSGYLAQGWQPLGRSGLGETVEAGKPDGGSMPCAACWARYLCSHSSVPSSPVNASADRREPTEERCAFWRAEVEVGLRFYHRLAHADPLQAMRLFDEPDLAIDPFDGYYPLEQPKIPF